ncbi:MAG: GFA family protein [Pseudomonadota bacterium]
MFAWRAGWRQLWTASPGLRGRIGASAAFHFCPVCGATVYWEPSGAPDLVTVAVGAFADPGFPPPQVSVYEERQHPWALAAGQLPLEHQF